MRESTQKFDELHLIRVIIAPYNTCASTRRSILRKIMDHYIVTVIQFIDFILYFNIFK
jgi:hypothetical protein